MTNRKISWLLSFIMLALLASTPAQAATAQGFFVSPQGSDDNNGTSPATAFQTFARAQNAMRGSAIKTTYLMSGLYQSQPTLELDTHDNNETWQAYPGQTPVLDGGNILSKAISIATDDIKTNSQNITLRGLTIRNYTDRGLSIWKTTNALIENNIVYNIKGMGIMLVGGVSHTTVSHNLIHHITWRGIQVSNDSLHNANDNITLDGNFLHDVDQTPALYDTGAIYINDRIHREQNIVVENNLILNYGDKDENVGARAIYLDDESSNVTVHDNFVGGSGGWALQVHGGDHIHIYNNVFDITEASQGIGAYLDDVKSGFPNYGMADVSFKDNIVYRACNTKPKPLWFFQDYTNGQIAPLTNTHNRYYNMTPNDIGNAKIPDTNAAYTASCAPSNTLRSPSIQNAGPPGN